MCESLCSSSVAIIGTIFVLLRWWKFSCLTYMMIAISLIITRSIHLSNDSANSINTYGQKCLRKLKSKLSELQNSDKVKIHFTKLVQFLYFPYVIRTFKGQLISEWNFCVFKSPKMATKFLTDFCLSFIEKISV